jgi:hypothetical protein
MGYLDNSSVTVDAILTNKGREVLAQGGQLNVTKFALSDDEIDYDLWNPAHTLGTNYYGAVIENMPVLEALPDETQMLRYKLVTLPKDATGIPVISVSPSAISFTSLLNSQTITPSTTNMAGANSTLGYTVILSDDTVASLEVDPAGAVTGTTNAAAGFIGDSITTAGKTVVRVGTKFIITPKQQANTTRIVRALLTIIGNETGGFKTISVTVDPTNFLVQNVAPNTDTLQ